MFASAIEMEATMAAGFEPSFERHTGGIQTRVGPDVIGLLAPRAPRAAERLRTLRQRSNDAHALIPKFADRHEANTARGDAERRLQRLLAPRSENGFDLREGDPQVVQARQALARLADEARWLEELERERSERWRSASRPLQACESWLKDGGVPPGVMLVDHEVDVPKLVKGESITDAIERLRRRGREVKATIHSIQSSCFPRSYCKGRMREQVGALAQAGTPDVATLIEFDRDIAWPTMRVQSSVYNTGTPAIAFAEVPDTVALLAWAFRDALIARLDAEIDAEADDAAALTHEQRQQREAEAQGDLLAIERDESWLVWSAQAQNLPVEHRADINPVALLGVRLVTAPTVNRQGTSPEHVITFGGR
jgi:hypothetical protein